MCVNDDLSNRNDPIFRQRTSFTSAVDNQNIPRSEYNPGKNDDPLDLSEIENMLEDSDEDEYSCSQPTSNSQQYKVSDKYFDYRKMLIRFISQLMTIYQRKRLGKFSLESSSEGLLDHEESSAMPCISQSDIESEFHLYNNY